MLNLIAKTTNNIHYFNRHIKKHPCPCDICLPTTKYSRRERLAGIKTVNDIHHNKLNTIYRPLLKNLKDQFRGKNRCFIIGNGPSLNRTNLSKLKNEISFGVNGIFLNTFPPSFRPTFYVVEDHLVAEDRAEQINQFNGVIKLFPTYLAYCLREAPDTIFFNHLPRKSAPHGFDFSLNASEVTYTGGTVTFTCMQLAYFLGFKEIILIGVDHSYTIPPSTKKQTDYNIEVLDMDEDDPNHFSTSYFGKGFRWHNPHVEKMEKAYLEAKKITTENGVSIINATKGGNLEVFDRKNYDDFFTNQSNLQYSPQSQTLINIPVCIKNRKPIPHIAVDFHQKDLLSNPFTTNKITKTPKVLIVSSTPLGKDSATGALMSKLFTKWPKSHLAQLHIGKTSNREYCNTNIYFNPRSTSHHTIKQNILNFQPDLIYFRLTDDIQLLLFIQNLITEINIPLVTHIMDDWPQKILGTKPASYSIILPILCRLFDNADLNLSISTKMSIAFAQRFNSFFYPISNFIGSDEIKESVSNNIPTIKVRPNFVIRYCGSITPDMQLQSLLDIALAVKELQNELPITLEIFTHSRFKQNTQQFRKIKKVSISFFTPDDDYNQRLREADLLIIAANFDNNSLNYIRYSLANKLPEIMASGVPILAYGPLESATIEYIYNGKWAYTVTTQHHEFLTKKIREIFNDPEKRAHLGALAQQYALQHLNESIMKNTFQNLLINTANQFKKTE